MQVPILYDNRPSTPDHKRWLRDTTPMILYLEKELTTPSAAALSHPVIPINEVDRFYSLLLEDFSDEYMWTSAMYMRWAPAYDSHALSTRMLYEFGREMNIPMVIRRQCLHLRQWVLSVFGEGIVHPHHHRNVQDEYEQVLLILEQKLARDPYLGGAAPSIVDFGFSGPMFRHFSSDPTPRMYTLYAVCCMRWVVSCGGVK